MMQLKKIIHLDIIIIIIIFILNSVVDEEEALENLHGKGSLLKQGETANFKWFRDGVEFDPAERFNVMFKVSLINLIKLLLDKDEKKNCLTLTMYLVN